MTISSTNADDDRRLIADEMLRAQSRRLTQSMNANDRASAPSGGEPELTGIDIRPANAYEAVTRQMVESLSEDLREIKSRLNNLLFMIAGAILLDVIGRMIGA